MGQKMCEENNQQKQQSNNNAQKFDLTQLKVFSPVGRGAKGVVFHIRLENFDEDFALKVVLKSSMKSTRSKKNNNNDGLFEQNRILFEQQVLSEFDHPLLPRLKGVVETDNVIGYAIDYCPGGNLNLLRHKQVEKMFSDDIIRFYGAEMVLALEYLHKKGIVYRDLKPENVLIQDNGHLMLVDFDLSTKLAPKSPKTRSSYDSVKKPEPEKKQTHKPKFYGFCKSGIAPEDSVEMERNSIGSVESSEVDSVGKSNSFVGTEEYVAPEIIQGNGHDFAVDVWSLGVVLHEMLYGTTPFRGANRKETFCRILSKTPDLVGETTPLRDLIRKLLEKDPNNRITLEEIKEHEFFKGVNWDMIVRLARPPFLPERPDIGDGVDGIKAIDVESIVYGIFNKEEVPKNIEKNVDKPCAGSSTGSGSGTSRSNSNIGEEDNKEVIKNVWVEGLEQPSMSSNFLVF